MKRFLRWVRGVIGTGVTWALGWGAAFVAITLVRGFVDFGHLGQMAVFGMQFGFVAGASFSVILSIAERRHRLKQLSLWRVALWGGLGGAALIPLAALRAILGGHPIDGFLATVLVPLGMAGVLGAVFASGSVALARRAETKMIEGSGESDPALEGEAP